jgi:hypothetical protein
MPNLAVVTREVARNERRYSAGFSVRKSLVLSSAFIAKTPNGRYDQQNTPER